MKTNLRESRTVMGKKFYYTGEISGDVIVYPTDKSGNQRSNGIVPINSNVILFIKSEIQRNREIAMGACRDDPSRGSLGEKLRDRRWSPQYLSYIVPLLIEARFCETFKEGRSHILRCVR